MCATECNKLSQFCKGDRANCNTWNPDVITDTINTHDKHDCYISPRNTRGTWVTHKSPDLGIVRGQSLGRGL